MHTPFHWHSDMTVRYPDGVPVGRFGKFPDIRIRDEDFGWHGPFETEQEAIADCLAHDVLPIRRLDINDHPGRGLCSHP